MLRCPASVGLQPPSRALKLQALNVTSHNTIKRDAKRATIRIFPWAAPMCPCRFDAEDYASPLYLTEDAKPSRFFGSMPKKVRRDLQEHPLAMENHGNGECLICGCSWLLLGNLMALQGLTCTATSATGGIRLPDFTITVLSRLGNNDATANPCSSCQGWAGWLCMCCIMLASSE